jgi:hypothetical protein
LSLFNTLNQWSKGGENFFSSQPNIAKSALQAFITSGFYLIYQVSEAMLIVQNGQDHFTFQYTYNSSTLNFPHFLEDYIC